MDREPCPHGDHVELKAAGPAAWAVHLYDIVRWRFVGEVYLIGTCRCCRSTVGLGEPVEQQAEEVRGAA